MVLIFLKHDSVELYTIFYLDKKVNTLYFIKM